MENPILLAARVAADAHRGQTRYDGEPYINHPMRVAGTVSLVDYTTVPLVVSAWLHDVVEDADVSLATIQEMFGPTVANLVGHMTNVYTKDAYPKMNRKERKRAEVERLASTDNYSVHTLKLADRYDNTHKMLARGRSWARTYVRETEDLADALTAGDSQLRKLLVKRAKRLRKQL